MAAVDMERATTHTRPSALPRPRPNTRYMSHVSSPALSVAASRAWPNLEVPHQASNGEDVVLADVSEVSPEEGRESPELRALVILPRSGAPVPLEFRSPSECAAIALAWLKRRGL
jgi:hypothetical protein